MTPLDNGTWYDKSGPADAGELDWMDAELLCVVDGSDVIVDEADDCDIDLASCDLFVVERCDIFAIGD